MNTEIDEAQEKPTSTEDLEVKEEPSRTEKGEAQEKPLEKMTVKDLREMAKEIPEISGVHGMKKEELIVAIKKVKGIKDAPLKKVDATVGELKKKIKVLKADRRAALEAKDKIMAGRVKRRIARLKKRTRRIAA